MDDLKMLLLALQGQVADLQGQMKALRASDRRQWQRLRLQHRLSLIFLGLMGLGAVLLFGGLEADDKALLERVATGVLATAIAGLVGVNLKEFDPSDGDEDGEN
jgi:type II secretory pathway component PulL